MPPDILQLRLLQKPAPGFVDAGLGLEATAKEESGGIGPEWH